MSVHIITCQAILFDLDGVLVDSAESVEATWRQWAARHGLDAAQVVAAAHGRRTIDTIRRIAPGLEADAEVAALAESEATTTQGVYEVPGAPELLEQLSADRWAVVTSGMRSVAMLRITHTRLPVPRVLVTADMTARGKPDPEGYLRAAHALGVAPGTCLVVEDAPVGLEAARAAGMRSIAVSSTYPPEALQMATVCVASLAKLRLISAVGALPIELGLPRGA